MPWRFRARSIRPSASPCTLDNCSPGAGACVLDALALAGSPCDADGNVCTGPDPDCHDGNPCTAEGCDPDTGCTYKNVADGTTCA